ncbi:MAG: glycosyltransferase family 9 protein [Simkaniaceae bacterium]
MANRKNAAVICAKGIGDGLLMMIAAAKLCNAGYAVDIFHPSKDLLAPLFPRQYHWLSFSQYNPSFYGLTILQNDHGENAWKLIEMRKKGILDNLKIFFPKKSLAFTLEDYLFDPQKSAAENIVAGMRKILHFTTEDKDNHLIRPSGSFRKQLQRIIIHPTSADKSKNWLPLQFFLLAAQLEKKGFSPVFTVSSEEAPVWRKFLQNSFSLLSFPDLSKLAAYLYESGFFIGNDSGIGHLASNLGIPTLTICGNRKISKIWRPDWSLSEIVQIPFPLPNFKGINMRIRERFWPIFIPVSKVQKKFKILQSRAYAQISSSH